VVSLDASLKRFVGEVWECMLEYVKKSVSATST